MAWAVPWDVARVPRERKIVFDTYHVLQRVATAVDQVQKAERRALAADGDGTLTRTTYLRLKNLVRGDTQTVHLVAFTPAPRLIRLQLAPTGGEQRVLNGQRAEAMVSYALKPQLVALAAIVHARRVAHQK